MDSERKHSSGHIRPADSQHLISQLYKRVELYIWYFVYGSLYTVRFQTCSRHTVCVICGNAYVCSYQSEVLIL